MATNEATILVADPDPAAARPLAAALTADGFTVVVAPTAATALASLAGGGVQVMTVALTFPLVETDALVSAAVLHGALPLAVGDAGQPAMLQTAMAIGCRGCVDGLAPAAAGAAVRSALQRQRGVARQREQYQRLRFQYQELRRQCAQQTERFQETQETFFLDLSRMMTIISNIMDGIVFVDRDGNVTLMNPVAEDLLGVRSFLALGKPLAALSGCDDLLRVLVADHRQMADLKEVTQTVEVPHTQQDLLYIKTITSRVLDYRGQVAGILSVLKDVTAEFKSDQLKNQYLSIVAHELRTPLTGIKTFSTMMCKGALGALTERQQRVVESIREQSLRLEHQIDKLINLGHLESDNYGQDREVFPLSDFVTGLIAPFEQPARDRQIELQFACAVEDLPLHADRADLRRACQALIENAVKFTADGGKVWVHVRHRADGSVEFAVKDTGIGVDPRYQRRIFEKFFQVEDPLTRHHGGAGLGLFVSRGIVEAHGSRIEVSSRLGQGAEFSFALPLYQRRAVESTAVAAVSAPVQQ